MYQNQAIHTAMFTKTMDIVNDQMKLALVNSVKTDAQIRACEVWADISAEEVADAGYVAGGTALSNPATEDTIDYGINPYNLSWSDVTWTMTNQVTVTHFVLYNDDDASDSIVAIWKNYADPTHFLAGDATTVKNITVRFDEWVA